MAKMACISGAVVGKIGGNVYSVNSGTQLVRAYQPNVANPSTELQVSNRVKFKLASQLAAAVSPVLAISREGMVSGRNQFVSATMGIITESQGTATAPLANIQLTKSRIVLPQLGATRVESAIECHLRSDARPLGVSRVVYSIFTADTNNQLQLIKTEVVSTPGGNGQFGVDISDVSAGQLFCYAYGLIEQENSILTKYENYQLNNAQFIASLISSRSSSVSGMKTTTTSCTGLAPA